MSVLSALHALAAHPVIYDMIQRAFGSVRIRRLMTDTLEKHGPSRGVALDVGGGTGLNSAAVPAGLVYICLDPDPVKLHAARAIGLCVRGDGRAIPIATGSVALTLCTAVSHHLDDADLAATIVEMRRLLEPGGTLLFLDALATSRVSSRALWRLDRGSHPRNAAALEDTIARCFEVVHQTRMRHLHEYLLIVATPRAER